MMTEQETWLYLAERWKQPSELDTGKAYLNFCIDEVIWQDIGLCDCINSLSINEDIDRVTAICMKTKISDYGEANNKTGYYWPTTSEGAKSRVAFCLEQAAKCEN